jgi:hypothetical protein
VVYEFEGPAVLTSTPYPGAKQEQKTVAIRIVPAHLDSPGEYAACLPNRTACILSAKGAAALLGGRTVWLRIDRVYQCQLEQFVAPAAPQKAAEAI